MGEQSGIRRGQRTPRVQALINLALAGGSECILWPGHVDVQGYAHLSIDHSTRTKAHRAIWIIANGESSQTIDHTCHDPLNCTGGPTCLHRRCINLDHLREASRGEQQHNSTNAHARERMAAMGRLGGATRSAQHRAAVNEYR